MKALLAAFALGQIVSFADVSYQGSVANLEKTADSVGMTLEYHFPKTETQAQLRPGSGVAERYRLDDDKDEESCMYTYSWYLPTENQVVISAHRPLFAKSFTAGSGLVLETRISRDAQKDGCPEKLDYPGQSQFDEIRVRAESKDALDAGVYHSDMFGDGRLLVTLSALSGIPAKATIEMKDGQFVISNIQIAHRPQYSASVWLKRDQVKQADLHLGTTDLHVTR